MIAPVEVAGLLAPSPLALPIGNPPVLPARPPQASFATMLATGVSVVDSKVGEADMLLRRLALNEDVPIHRVTAALEEARLAVEIAMQIRMRLVETYRDFMAMQL
jgi:flagellar hook-basal body complex protein FliE